MNLGPRNNVQHTLSPPTLGSCGSHPWKVPLNESTLPTVKLAQVFVYSSQGREPDEDESSYSNPTDMKLPGIVRVSYNT